MDLEPAIEFILQQQAKFHGDLTELAGVVNRIAQQQLDFNQMVSGFHQEYSAALMALAENQKQIQEDHKALSLKVGEMGDNLKALSLKVGEMGDNLNALIAIVDGQIRGPKQ